MVGARVLRVTAQVRLQNATTEGAAARRSYMTGGTPYCDTVHMYLNRIYDTVQKVRLPASVASWVPRQVETQYTASPVRHIQHAKPKRTSPQCPWLPQQQKCYIRAAAIDLGEGETGGDGTVASGGEGQNHPLTGVVQQVQVDAAAHAQLLTAQAA